MVIGQARCPHCGYKTTTGGIGEHIKHCLKNPENIKRQKAHPTEVKNSELPAHLQELINARELDSAIKLMDKSVNCLFLELPEAIASHNKEIWLNLKKLISEQNQKPETKFKG